MAILRGHARPVEIPLLDAILDHTYVTCAGGYGWPCWGDCIGGTILRTGSGSSTEADCISKPNSHAGIEYGITGLCHQTANRILTPAGIMVDEAVGYGITEFIYGSHGTDAAEWAERRGTCGRMRGELPECMPPESPERVPTHGETSPLLPELLELYERRRVADSAPDFELLGGVLELRVHHVLGLDFAAERMARLRNVQGEALTEKARLDRQLRGRDTSGRGFAAASNELIGRALAHSAELLGERAYIALFDMQPGARILVVRPDICGVVYDGLDPNEIR